MNESVLADVIRPGAGRSLDFVNLDELRKRTGITPREILKFAMSEMICNSLDTDATEICVNIETRDGFHWLTVRDNGSKRISEDDLRLILNFDNKASSKRGFLSLQRLLRQRSQVYIRLFLCSSRGSETPASRDNYFESWI